MIAIVLVFTKLILRRGNSWAWVYGSSDPEKMQHSALYGLAFPSDRAKNSSFPTGGEKAAFETDNIPGFGSGCGACGYTQ